MNLKMTTENVVGVAARVHNTVKTDGNGGVSPLCAFASLRETNLNTLA